MMILKNKLIFLKGVNRDTQHLFAKPGQKSGNVVNVRLPARFLGRVGETYSAESYVETNYPVTIRPLQGMDVDVPSTEWALNINDTKTNILEPAMAQLVNNIERDCMQLAYQGVANYVGTIGTAAASSTTVLQANAYLSNEGAPDDDTRKMLLSVNTNVSLVPAFQGLFNPANKLAGQFEKGLIGKNTLGFDHYQTQNIWNHRVGLLGGVPVVNATAGQTGTNIQTSGWTPSRIILKKGDVVEFAAVNAVNAMTRSLYGGLRHFTITADVTSDGGGLATLPISPALIPGVVQFATVDAAPAAGAAITVFGIAAAGQAAIAGTVSAQCLGFHKDAFTVAGISQVIPKGSTEESYQATDPDTGLQLRFLRQFEGRGNNFINRFDVLYAFGVPYPQVAVRMLSL